MDKHGQRVTKLLEAIDAGDPGAAEELFPLVYDELRARAGALMSHERYNHTLQRTALVHEAYLKLVGSGAGFLTRLHFFNAAAQAMRRILVDHAARRNSLKRGGARLRLDLDEIDEPMAAPAPDAAMAPAVPLDWVTLDQALRRLEQVAPRQHQVVMLRFFSGRTEAEIAQMLQVSRPTVRRDWAAARVWLYGAMKRDKTTEC